MKSRFIVILLCFTLVTSCNKKCTVTAIPSESHYIGRQYLSPSYFDSTYTWYRYYFVENYSNNIECNNYLKNYVTTLNLDTTSKINTFVFLKSCGKSQKLIKSGNYNSMAESKISSFERVVISYNRSSGYMDITYKENLNIIKSEKIMFQTRK